MLPFVDFFLTKKGENDSSVTIRPDRCVCLDHPCTLCRQKLHQGNTRMENVPQQSIAARKGSLSCFIVHDRQLKDQYGFIGLVCTSRTHAHTLRCRQTKRKAPATCCPFLWLTSVLHMRDSRGTQDETRTKGAGGIKVQSDREAWGSKPEKMRR